MKKNLGLFIIFIIFCVTLCIERITNMTNIEVSEGNLKIFDLVTKEYLEKELIAISLLDYSIYEYGKKYPIECLREEYNHYRLVYYGDSGYLIIYFDMNGKKVFSKYFKKSISYDEFMEIKQGIYYKDVMEIDRNGNYDSFYASSTTEYRSEHYTNDGYHIIIEYDNDLKVSKFVINYI